MFHHKRLSAALLAILVMACFVLPGFSTLSYAADPAPDMTSNFSRATTQVRGMFVSTRNNRDFPTIPGMSGSAMDEQFDKIIAYCQQNGFNTIFFEARPMGDAFYQSKYYPTSRFWTEEQGRDSKYDPLSSLMKKAKENGLAVYAVVNTLQVANASETPQYSEKNLASQYPDLVVKTSTGSYLNPADEKVVNLICDGAAELAKNYNVDGILLNQIDDQGPLTSMENYDADLTALIKAVSQKVKASNANTQFGVLVDGVPGDFTKEKDIHAVIQTLVDDGSLQFVIPDLYVPTDSTLFSYEQALTYWSELIGGHTTALYTLNSAEKLAAPTTDLFPFSDPQELNYQLFANSIQAKVGGCIFNGFSALMKSPVKLAQNLSGQFSDEVSLTNMGVDLNISQKFEITRPTKALTTTYKSYFITGTSNPNSPVYFQGKEIEQASYGGFGVLVELDVGANTYTFSQDGVTKTVSITRKDASSQAVPITKIVNGSCYPYADSYARAGETLTLKCVAPSGATVSAKVDGQVVPLKQVAVAEDGVPATFTGELEMSNDYLALESLGQVVYTLTYQGKSTNYKSGGELFVAGEDTPIAVEVISYVGNVYGDTKKQDEFLTTLKLGSSDYVVDQTDNYFTLKSGGMIPKSEVDFIVGKTDITNKVSSYALSSTTENAEILSLKGSDKPVFHAEMRDNALFVTFYNTVINEGDLKLSSKLVKSVTSTKTADGGMQLELLPADGVTLWGYNIEYKDDGVTEIFLKKKPTLSNDYAKPLSGISVTIDPGHGGNDVGAMGIAGSTGPYESNINLAAGIILKNRLEQLGATVYMTRMDTSDLTLHERMQKCEATKSDFFISLHHNSTLESKDSSKIDGVEVYYHEPQSEQFAATLVKQVSGATGRDNNGSFQDYYRVTRMTYAPSVLLELGYLPNPTEYGKVVNPLQIYRSACAVADSILVTLG